MHSTKVLGVALLFLAVIAGLVWYAVLREDRAAVLRVSFLDVGQGDAIFIEAPNGRQVLIDGGPDGAVLRRLGEVMPWYDRTIDLVIPTHPDLDHIGGIIDVLARYRIGHVLQSSVLGKTAAWDMLQKSIEREESTNMIAVRGQVIDLGSRKQGNPRAYIEVLSPDRDVPNVETNMGCVITRLVYGNTAFVFSCDAPQKMEAYLVSLDSRGDQLRADVLKAGHHGSKTSSSLEYIQQVNPAYAVFSRGCENKYGHPSAEVVERFAVLGVPTYDTCEQGTVTFVSDGSVVTKI
jgi:competence protein ComEC